MDPLGDNPQKPRDSEDAISEKMKKASGTWDRPLWCLEAKP